MHVRILGFLLLLTLARCAANAADDSGPLASPIDRAYSRLYNFDFNSTHRILDQYISAHPSDSVGYAVRAAAYLFSELDRLMILESDFFTDDRRINEKKKLKPDPALKRKLFAAVEKAQQAGRSSLASDPRDRNALFAMAMAAGIKTDYSAFVEKRQLASLSYAKESQSYAVRLLQADPKFYDAYLTTGLSEYLVSSLPFFVRWFVRFEQTKGSKEQAVKNLQLVARSGRYLGPFAKILLAVIHLREKAPRESKRLLEELAQDYPENPLFHRELARLSARLVSE